MFLKILANFSMHFHTHILGLFYSKITDFQEQICINL